MTRSSSTINFTERRAWILNWLLESSFIYEFCFLHRSMEWTTTHDMLLCREILAEEFHKIKNGSNERPRIWAQNLNSVAAVKFTLNQREVRERFDLLIGRFRQQNKEEVKASAVSPAQKELDALLEEISERQKLAEFLICCF